VEQQSGQALTSPGWPGLNPFGLTTTQPAVLVQRGQHVSFDRCEWKHLRGAGISVSIRATSPYPLLTTAASTGANGSTWVVLASGKSTLF
jgi:hypothetical protein